MYSFTRWLQKMAYPLRYYLGFSQTEIYAVGGLLALIGIFSLLPTLVHRYCQQKQDAPTQAEEHLALEKILQQLQKATTVPPATWYRYPWVVFGSIPRFTATGYPYHLSPLEYPHNTMGQLFTYKNPNLVLQKKPRCFQSYTPYLHPNPRNVKKNYRYKSRPRHVAARKTGAKKQP